VIKKGLELKVSYGSRTNKYLALWYGFSLTENHYDSYTFRLVIDDKVAKRAGLKFGLLNCFLSNDDRAKGYLNVNDYIVSTQLITTEFHSKLGRFNNDLLIFLRGHLHQGWIKENPELKNGSKFTLSIPFDLNFEIFIVQRYVEMHTELLLQFSRSDFEDEKILRHGNISGPRRAIVTCELGYKRILSRQIRLGNILLSILKSIKKSNQEFRKIYLSRNSEVDLPGENHLEYRLMLSHYLKRLFLSQLVK
jgi:hypothetical protein